MDSNWPFHKVGRLTWQKIVNVPYKNDLHYIQERYENAYVKIVETDEENGYNSWTQIYLQIKFKNDADEAEFIMRESI